MESEKYNICFGFDHAGRELSLYLMEHLRGMGNIVFCPQQNQGIERDVISYPTVVPCVVKKVLTENFWGVLICGSGIGMSIAANRYVGIRAALCRDSLDSVLARQHNNANVFVAGSRGMSPSLVLECLLNFLTTSFTYGRHSERVQMLDHMLPQRDL
ncbi:putative sugar phosphate isomerase [Holospora obtusa F1]|uniref:Sugar phosphate isomerase n=1 Tax=Holospora obtusa F1 TaxID=1399147 RepID=W6TDB3_HOLOB|nr:RpiB/LacA/LacB family sugar-phosphate isomerase [Holospora obtusa]ETZ06983.1 putative sugar phosphate isomerase [Holospora obtusa F1]